MQRIKLSSVKSNVLYSLIATAMEHFQEQLHAPRATSQSNLFKFKYQFLFLQIMRVCVAQPSSYPASHSLTLCNAQQTALESLAERQMRSDHCEQCA